MTPNDLQDSFKSTLLIDNQVLKSNLSSNTSVDISDKIHTIFLLHPSEDSEGARNTIISIAQACQLSPDVYAIMTVNFAWHQIRSRHHIKNVILFGNLEQQLALNITLPIHYNYNFDNRTWIKTVPMLTLMQDKAAKTALWNTALKKHFIA